MTAGKTIPAKVTRPALSGGVHRKRLFSLLDDKLKKPVVWVSAAAGSGKTTLVSSYLEARRLPCIWYQCDDGDADLATFFYYMGLAVQNAAPWYKTSLPLLTPEYLAGIPAFTRRYFEALYNRLLAPPPASGKTPSNSLPATKSERKFAIILDNYQDVPADAVFHGMIARGLKAVPEGIHFVVISRSEPPRSFIRLRANGRIELLQPDELSFTLAEIRRLARNRFKKLKDERLQAMHQLTGGWAAGIILMLEREDIDATDDGAPGGAGYEKIFDYFAGEVFDGIESKVRDFLLKTACLPVVSVALAEKLTGAGTVQHILAALQRNHFFTERLAGGRDYQYHPLFRDFLLSRAKIAFAPGKWAAVRKKAARLLEENGRIEDAAKLYSETGDRQALARLVTRHARPFLIQGRNQIVEKWIAALPAGALDQNPWLSYWAAMCSFPMDMPGARKHFEKALAAFKKLADSSGIYLCWVGIVDTYAFELDEWKHLDACIAAFDELKKKWPSFPSKEMELLVASRMLIALTMRQTDRPHRVHKWLQHVSDLLREKPSFEIQMDTVFSLSLYYLWKGEYDRNAVLLEEAEAAIQQNKPSPFAVIRIKLMRGIHCWVTAAYDAALQILSEGLDVAAAGGVRVFDSLLWGFKAAAQMASGNLTLAAKSIERQRKSLLGTQKTLDAFFYHTNAAWYALLDGRPFQAAEHMETISAGVARLGTPYYRSLWHMGMAQVAYRRSRSEEAKTHIRTAHRIGLAMKSHVLEWYALLIDAYILLREGRETEGIDKLRRGLLLARRHGFVHLEFYQPAVMQFLYARALEEGIAREYVKKNIRILGLAPPASPEAPAPCLEAWPYPVKIYTLGRFEMLSGDKPIEFAGKVQKKPLELLKALIAYGGRDVPAGRLTDQLWPEADGDLAHKSLETTLGRLRRLLGQDDLITFKAGQLSINPLYCWVDSFALAQLLDQIEDASDHAAPLREKAVALYKGPFLAADIGLQWALPCRETLRNRLLRVILAAGRRCEQAGKWEKAAGYYTKGIETDYLAEECYRRLMVSYRNLGWNAEAARTYLRCRDLLQAELGLAPSMQTQAIYADILQKR